MKTVFAVFYWGWPGQGFKGCGSTEDRAAAIVDALIERGEAAPGVRYEGCKFTIVPVQVNAAEIGGRVVPLRDRDEAYAR